MKTKLSRREYKIIIDDQNISNFLNIINQEFDKLHEDRCIKSLYFDTISYKLYRESLFQDSDRLKIRFRNYPQVDKKIYREIKFNNREGKNKTVEEVSFNSFEEIKDYYFRGVEYFPSSFVEYTRSYFIGDNVRLTFDRDLKYTSHEFRGLKTDSVSRKIVIEYKLLKNRQNNLYSKLFFDKNDSIQHKLIKNPQKFSKYVDSVANLYNL